jgi:hypothetical protein
MAGVPEAWVRYRQITPGAFTATLSGSADPQPGLRQSVDAIIERSDELRDAVVAHLDGASDDERELAALQLQAAAAVDLDRANALAAMDEGGAHQATLSDADFVAIDRILSTPTQQGISALLDLADGGFMATASESATLKEAVCSAVDNITRGAQDATKATVRGVIGFAELELAKELTRGVVPAFEELADKLSWLKRRAVALVLRAVEKLLAVFGSKTASARNKIAGWASELEDGKTIALLERLYHVDALKAEFGSRIDGVLGGISSGRDADARRDLEILEKKWHLRTNVIGSVAALAGYARTWIWSAAFPLGAIAYATGFAAATGYVVLAGGDYLDWREGDGLLNLVEGVGSIVNRAVEA